MEKLPELSPRISLASEPVPGHLLPPAQGEVGAAPSFHRPRPPAVGTAALCLRGGHGPDGRRRSASWGWWMAKAFPLISAGIRLLQEVSRVPKPSDC